MCLPKSESGLGLKKLVSWNQACIIQNIWAIIVRAGSPWIAWIQEYVLKGRCIWQITETPNGSWSWNKLLRLRSMAQRFIEVKDGKKVWKIASSRYRVAVVWGKIKTKKEKVNWHKLIWNQFFFLNML